MAPPNVKVMMLGPSGSGKTTQLAAMYYGMGVGEHHVQLKPGNEQTLRELGAVVTRILGPEPVLPPGTALAAVKEWPFLVQARGDDGGDPQTVFRLTYFDYAGEHGDNFFKDPKTRQDEIYSAATDFRKAINTYDILLGVLDGEKIARAMDSVWEDGDDLPEGANPPELEREIWQTIVLLSQSPEKIIHLVLTKWDELERRDYSLAQVVRFLDRYESFRRLRTTRPHGRLRLIPVSAFGTNGYLRTGPDGIEKDRNRTWKPANTSMPVACALMDIVAAEVGKIEATRPDPRQRRLRKEPAPLFAELLSGLGLAAFVVATSLVWSHLLPWLGRRTGLELQVPVGALIGALRKAIRRRDGPDGESPTQPLMDLPNYPVEPVRRAATARLFDYCAQEYNDLEDRFPDSNLTP